MHYKRQEILKSSFIWWHGGENVIKFFLSKACKIIFVVVLKKSYFNIVRIFIL